MYSNGFLQTNCHLINNVSSMSPLQHLWAIKFKVSHIECNLPNRHGNVGFLINIHQNTVLVWQSAGNHFIYFHFHMLILLSPGWDEQMVEKPLSNTSNRIHSWLLMLFACMSINYCNAFAYLNPPWLSSELWTKMKWFNWETVQAVWESLHFASTMRLELRFELVLRCRNLFSRMSSWVCM